MPSPCLRSKTPAGSVPGPVVAIVADDVQQRVDVDRLRQIESRVHAANELPSHRRDRYRDAYGLSAYDAQVLVSEPGATALFEGVLAAAPSTEPKAAANWVAGAWLGLLKTDADAAARVDATELADRSGRRDARRT